MIGTLLNQDFFSFLVVAAALIACRKPDIRTVAIAFFVAGYFSTQIPLRLGYYISGDDKLFLQSLVSMALICGYSTLPATRWLLLAMCCEAALIGVNLLTVLVSLHAWYHWAAFGIINYIAFTALCLNKWGTKHERRKPDDVAGAAAHAWDHVYTRNKTDIHKNQGVGK